MSSFSCSIVLLAGMVTSSHIVAAQNAGPLPSPLVLADVIRIASERRDEIQAARARTRAGEARPDLASAHMLSGAVTRSAGVRGVDVP